MLPDTQHSFSVASAVVKQLTFDLIFSGIRGIRVDGFPIGSHRHAAILNAIKVVVTKVRGDSGQNALDAPLASLVGVVVMFAGDGQQIDETLVDGEQRERQSRESFDQIADAAAFKRGVNEYWPTLATGGDQCFREFSFT